MKKIIPIIILFALAISCNDLKPKLAQVIISGKIENFKDSTFTLSQKDYENIIQIHPDGSFSDTIYDFEDGYFKLFSHNEFTDLYLKDGYDIFMYLDVDSFDESLKYEGIGALENNYLAKKILFESQNRPWDLCREDEKIFIYKLDSLFEEKDLLLEEYKKIAPDFDTSLYQLEKYGTQYFKAYVKEIYQNNHRFLNANDSFEVSKDFYAFRNDIDLENTKNQTAPFYFQYLNAFIHNNSQESDSLEYAFAELKTIDSHFKDNKLKKELIYQSAQRYMPKVKKLDEYWALVSFMITDKEKYKKLKEKYNTLQKLIPGANSPRTSFTDIKHNSFSLDDFKGKYVYIDCWAQWCGPCKREAPFLKKIEEKYTDKEIVFIKLSLDKDRSAWEKYLIKNNASYHSYIVDKAFDSDFAKAYLINSIPRFILLDKELKIIDSRAQRPSDDELVKTLDALLL